MSKSGQKTFFDDWNMVLDIGEEKVHFLAVDGSVRRMRFARVRVQGRTSNKHQLRRSSLSLPIAMVLPVERVVHVLRKYRVTFS